ncbi:MULTISPECIES: YhcH/YjgK/YiaL family protein [Eikenella]|uniref:YhcH/YjgK/YiaL family protein n=1 Tax=Eikenella longinqua TaxID=1795827 RepID=A0A1A9RW24_9NEIS|nr:MULTISPECIES: YhcH/YjgK/YiaL family protein [Eikenella]OAM26788.1 YhcH/YjgK/YiaL family protein [Eikenella longinqua]
MITDAIAHAARYAALHPDFPEAIRLLQTLDFARLPDGQIPCANPNIRLFLQTEILRAAEAARPEAHRLHIDIQAPVSAAETYGWIDRGYLKNSSGYHQERDIEFFDCPPQSWLTLTPGEFALFFPNDGHAPLVGQPGQPLRKALFKIRTEEYRIAV